MSAKCCLPVPVFHFWPKLTHPATQSAIAELLVTTHDVYYDTSTRIKIKMHRFQR